VTISHWIGYGLILLGMPFFLAGTIGLLRFPDVFTRLHALTKADNIGLGLITIGILLQTASLSIIFKLLLIWILILIASATTGHLIARAAIKRGVKPWQNRQI
jgi:multicomponent Na+:H+ antiporter subunit G